MEVRKKNRKKEYCELKILFCIIWNGKQILVKRGFTATMPRAMKQLKL